MQTPERVVFDRFEVDLHRRRLIKSGRAVRIQPKPFTVLALLLDRPGETVTRAELRDALWPADTHVEFETGINTAVRKLRRALGDTGGRPRFIQTAPGGGYRFVGTLVQDTGAGTRVPEMRPAVALPDGIASPRQSTGIVWNRRLAAFAALMLVTLAGSPLDRPGEWRSLADIGHQRFAAGDPAGAVPAFARAVARGATDEAVFVEYACALAALGRPTLALAIVEGGLTRLPRSVMLRANRGLRLHAVGRYDEELAALTDAVALDSTSADAQFHLGLGFARRREYDASLAALQRAVDLSGGAPHFVSWLGRIAADAGRLEQAEDILRKLKE